MSEPVGTNKIKMGQPRLCSTRRVNWSTRAAVKAWVSLADFQVLNLPRAKRPWLCPIKDAVAVSIIIDRKRTRADLDNLVKALLDYAVRIEAIADDSPKYVRKITIEWGRAPEGVRLVLTPCA